MVSVIKDRFVSIKFLCYRSFLEFYIYIYIFIYIFAKLNMKEDSSEEWRTDRREGYDLSLETALFL